uniref:SOUL heme-binding protein n=1 Tax=Tetradesmus obliquus TaxID=3088 RepID=A0A383W6F1_TETOB|eukprot:jgi/Sobl393_1/3707/SZX73227.1
MMMGTAAAQFVAPAFYKGLQGPKFTVLKKIGDNIELRRYEPGSWVSIKREGMQLDSAMSGSFMKLFGYISGGNAAGAKIEMTAPVLTKVVPGQGPTCESQFTMSFYNPWKYQSGAAPKPTDASVFINNVPAMDVYVLSFGGWANEAAYKTQAAALMQKLKAEKLPFDSSHWFTAGYDSPYTMANRHNEVWVPAAAAPAAAAAKAKPAASGH